ncbi:hypothetical protein EsH8_VI_000245 [Colletotrichum jinshuiense]
MKAEPDIAGKGVSQFISLSNYNRSTVMSICPVDSNFMTQVIAAFVFTAVLTLCSAVFCLLVGRTNEDRQTFNPIGRFIRKQTSEPVRRFIFRFGMNPNVHALVAYDLVNTLSDLQLVTGLAILVGGMKHLFDSMISTYQFMIVTDLAWFCTNTHLLSLVVIRSMRNSVKRTRPERYNHEHIKLSARLARALRIFFMASTLVLLMYAFWVTGNEGIYNKGQFRCPMKCALNQPKGGHAAKMLIANMVLMGYFYKVRIFQSWRTGRILWMDHIRGILIDKRGQPMNVLQPEAIFKGWTGNPLLKDLKLCLLAVWYFLASELDAILGFMIAHADTEMGWDDKHEENDLVFSQLVPLFLLIIPFMGLFESYAKNSGENKEIELKRMDVDVSESS